MILKGSIQKYVWSGWWIKLKFLLCITVAIGGTDLSNMRHTCKMASNQRCDDQPFIIFMCSPWCSSLHPNALHNHWGNWISQASWSQNRKLQTCFKKQTSQYPWNNPCTLVQQITHILGKVYGQLVTCLPLGVHIESHHPQNGEPVPFLNLTPGKNCGEGCFIYDMKEFIHCFLISKKWSIVFTLEYAHHCRRHIQYGGIRCTQWARRICWQHRLDNGGCLLVPFGNLTYLWTPWPVLDGFPISTSDVQ